MITLFRSRARGLPPALFVPLLRTETQCRVVARFPFFLQAADSSANTQQPAAEESVPLFAGLGSALSKLGLPIAPPPGASAFLASTGAAFASIFDGPSEPDADEGGDGAAAAAAATGSAAPSTAAAGSSSPPVTAASLAVRTAAGVNALQGEVAELRGEVAQLRADVSEMKALLRQLVGASVVDAVTTV